MLGDKAFASLLSMVDDLQTISQDSHAHHMMAWKDRKSYSHTSSILLAPAIKICESPQLCPPSTSA
jgi:hypothetical protein